MTAAASATPDLRPRLPTYRHSRTICGTISMATINAGRCHYAGGQTPSFARSDDVNLAYQAAVTVVDLTNSCRSRPWWPKCAGGHNCWLASPGACGDILTTWISNWAECDQAAKPS